MKKIKNMNYEETKQAFGSFSKKHSIKDDFDMSYSVINSIKPLLTDSEEIINTLYNVFCYGFMAGYKQSEAEHRKADKKVLDLSKDVFKDKEKLLRLIYDMPWWADTSYQYLYSFIAHGMTHNEPTFPMSNGHEEEVNEYVSNYQKEKQQNDAKEKIELNNRTLEEKELIKYQGVCIKLLCELNNIHDLNISKYLYNIMLDIAKDEGIEVSEIKVTK